jgi:hypothetical protein
VSSFQSAVLADNNGYANTVIVPARLGTIKFSIVFPTKDHFGLALRSFHTKFDSKTQCLPKSSYVMKTQVIRLTAKSLIIIPLTVA